MTDHTPDPPEVLPTGLVQELQNLSDHELREVISYSGDLIEYHDEELISEIDADDEEEIVRVEERDGYTEVVKRVPCGENCEECPHGPYLYHVRPIPEQEGDDHLQWQFIGRIE
jgi:hypothetical protein